MRKDFVLFLIILSIYFCGYILCIGSYPLLDVDETRYVNMAKEMFHSKDYMTLYLNGNFFFEKPPLFFWIECLSFKILGGVNEFSARLPIILLSFLPLVLLFILCKKIKGVKFAFISSAVLLTSLEYILITKIAILDSVLTSFVTSSCICYFFTHFVQNKNKKYFWILTYIFSALAVLSKGIPGFVIPFGIILISTVVFKTYRETLKYLPAGLLLFLGIALPWHIAMLKKYPELFFQEYIYKHHILRFLGSDVIHRTEPWYFYILTLLWGLFPHIFVFISKFFSTIKTKITNRDFSFNNDKFLTLNIIASLVILIFFSLSGAKLITYILPIYPFLAVIIGNIWNDIIKDDEKKFKNFAVSLLVFVFFIGILTPFGYKLDYSFGQNELMDYAKLAKDNNYTISTYKTGTKYSLLYYSGLKHIYFQNEEDLEWLNKELDKNNNILIAKNKYIKDLPLKIKVRGKKYSIIERGEYAKK